MITQTLDLNLIPGRVLPMVNVSQYDKDSRTLEFTIYNGDQSFDLTGLSAYIQGLKPDGHGFNYSATVSSTKITADVTEQMTACAGRVMCEVIIMSGTDRIGTGNFILNVEAAAMPDGSNMSASEYSYVEQLIEEAQEVVADAEEQVENAEAWAVGERNGTAVPATDETYHNNSKYYAGQASSSATNSANSALMSESYTHGGTGLRPLEATDNAKYYMDEAKAASVTQIQEITDTVLADETFPGSCLLNTHYGMSAQNGTPTPSSPVAIENAKANYRDCGKNLNAYPYYQTTKTENGVTFTDNGDGTITVSTVGTGATAGTSFQCHNRLNTEANELRLKNGSYVLSGCPSGGSTQTYCLLANRTYNNANNNLAADIGNGATAVLNGDDYGEDGVNLGIIIQISKDTIITTPITFKPMLRLATVEDATYEPYNGEEISTNLTLRAIEVTSSDDYNLVKDEKYYIADTLDKIDGGYQITRRVQALTVDGSENWKYNQESGKQRFGLRLLTLGYANNKYVRRCISDHFVNDISGNIGTWGSFRIGAGADDYIIVTNNDLAIASLAEFKTWLGNNNTKFMYCLDTPTTENVSAENAKKLLSIKSHSISTYISQTEDTEGVMVIEYPTSELTSKALTGYVKAEKNGILLDEFLCGQTTAGTYSVSATVDANEKVTYAWT